MRGRAGETGADGTEWVSESTVVCRMGGGKLGSLGVGLTVVAQVNSLTSTLSYVEGAATSWSVGNIASTGGASISLLGSNLGVGRYGFGTFSRDLTKTCG